MKRLSDRSEPMSPIEAGAISLLRSVERYQPPPGLKQRVRARLLASRSAVRFRLIRPVIAGAFLLLAAGASAAIGGTWAVRQYLAARTSTTELAKQSQPTVVPVERTQGPSVREPEPSAISSALGLPDSNSSPTVVGSLRNARNNARGTAKASEQAKPPEPGKPSEQVKLVFDSMRALRRDGQPERAARLLDEYLRRYPGGALAEEALALSIEAASMLGEPRAKDLANRYLARYPNGQFQKAAERARTRFSP